MKKLPTLKIGCRLIVAFGVQIVLLAATAGYAIDRMDVLEKHVTEIAAVNQREFALASDMKNAVSERFRGMERLTAPRASSGGQLSTSELDDADQRYANSEAALASSFSLSSSTSPDELMVLSQARELHMQVAQVTRNLLQQIGIGDLAEARRIQADLAPILRQWRDTLSRLEEIQLDQNVQVVDETSRLVARAHWVMLVISAFALLVSASLAWSITSGITRPLNRLLSSMHAEMQHAAQAPCKQQCS